jgi:hypothetical protein
MEAPRFSELAINKRSGRVKFEQRKTGVWRDMAVPRRPWSRRLLASKESTALTFHSSITSTS